MPQPTTRPVRARAGHIQFSQSARTAIVRACRRGRPQVVLLSWPGGATYLPHECYEQGDFDVVVGHVAGCPIYADVRQLAMFPDRRVLIDAERTSRLRPHPHPPLSARALSAARLA